MLSHLKHLGLRFGVIANFGNRLMHLFAVECRK